MSQSTTVLVTLIVYKVILILFGFLASRHTKDAADFFLGGRKLGPWVAALSASASSSSAWTLLGVSGAAYAWGLSAIWLFPACLSGFAINWFVVAPRLQTLSRQSNALTVTELLAGPSGAPLRNTVVWIASFIVLFSFTFYVGSQFQGSGKTFQSTFGMDATSSIVLGSAIIIFYTMIGGFWAVSFTDALQGMVMVATAILLPMAAFLAVGGPGGFWTGVHEVPIEGFASFTRSMHWPAALGFIAGLMGIGLGYPGQPHVINRFMALKNQKAVRTGRRVALTWAVLVYGGMIVLGICGRLLYPEMADKETVFFQVATQLFHPVFGGIMIAGVLSATMSTADSQLLVASSSVSNDLPLFSKQNTLLTSRVVVVVLSVASVVIALVGTQEIFSRVLFAWTALGSAFGPLILVLIFKGPIRGAYTAAAMSLGFGLSVLAYSIPDAKGTWLERILPFLVALAIAYWGANNQKTPVNDPTISQTGH